MYSTLQLLLEQLIGASQGRVLLWVVMSTRTTRSATHTLIATTATLNATLVDWPTTSKVNARVSMKNDGGPME